MKIDPKERLFAACVTKVEKAWGQHALQSLGASIYRALLSQAVLELCTNQDESISPATVREILNYCQDRIIDVTEGA